MERFVQVEVEEKKTVQEEVESNMKHDQRKKKYHEIAVFNDKTGVYLTIKGMILFH